MAEGEKRRKGRLNAVLFVLTFLSVFLFGLRGLDDLSFRSILDPRLFGIEALYALPVMIILAGHELGHYLTCRRYGLDATLPFFIPFPNLIGTMGAFIRIKSPVSRRQQFFDIGASGPLAGFVLALPVLVIGLALSKVMPMTQTGLFGDPLLLKLIAGIILGPIPAGSEIALHPIGFAGWVGLLVTGLNLIPVGQLDGGHVAYALLGPKAAKLAPLILVILIAMGIFLWAGWLLWAGLVALAIFRPRFRHPRAYDEERPLSRGRVIIGLAVVLVLIVSFIPVPIKGYDLLGLLKLAGLGVK